jgi:hypothetical protein
MSTELRMPMIVARTNTCQTWTVWVAASTKSRKLTPIATVWVTYRVRRLGRPSAIRPPNRPRTRTGPNWATVNSPRSKGLPVSWRISQLWATAVIQVPIIETSWPPKKSR